MERSSVPSSPVSSLSSLESIDFPREGHTPEREISIDDTGSHLDGAQPPSKKRRVVAPYNPLRDPHNFGSLSNAPFQPADDGLTDVSSDTTGSVPGSPSARQAGGPIPDEEALGIEQVRICGWDGCNIGELENMDELVKHVHDDHIGSIKRTRYSCEWGDCKGRPRSQMSAYALRAHMRSHTKEKPFYCALPECDRSFTRSDALAKHMRTVHETESLRVAEHYAKAQKSGTHGSNVSPHESTSPPTDMPIVTKAPKSLKLVFGSSKQNSTPPITTNGESNENTVVLPADAAPLSPTSLAALLGPLPASLSFTPAEAMLPRQQLFRLLRRQIHWATQEETELAHEICDLERQRREEWLAKELVMENLLEAGFRKADKKGAFTDQSLKPVVERKKARVRQGTSFLKKRVLQDLQIAEALPVRGASMPWYRGADGRPSGGMGLDGADDEDDVESAPEEHDHEEHDDVDETEFPHDETMDVDMGRQGDMEQKGMQDQLMMGDDGPIPMPSEPQRDVSLGLDDTEEEEAD